jgi:polyisoprenoid-binding protein YceI
MKKFYLLVLIVISVIILSFINGKINNKYRINEKNCLVLFKIYDKIGSIRTGTFSQPAGIINFSNSNPGNGYFKVSLEVKSLDTKNELRDKVLLSSHFFNVNKYPLITFESKKIIVTGQDYEVKGNLTIKKVTKEITIPFKFTENGNEGNFESEFIIKRLDYGVGIENETVGNDVFIKLIIPVTKTIEKQV